MPRTTPSIDPIEEPEKLPQWEGRIADMLDVAEAALLKKGLEPAQARHLAATVVLALAFEMGGRMVYLPKGDELRRAVRDAQLFREFKGDNHAELSRRYQITVTRVYAIIQHQVELQRRRGQIQRPKPTQADLFECSDNNQIRQSFP